MVEQPFFVFESPSITGEVTILANHPVTGYNNRNWILTISHPYCTNCLDVADADGEFFIGDRFSKWDSRQFRPHALLKIGSMNVKLDIKKFSTLEKIFIQFAHALLCNFIWNFFFPDCGRKEHMGEAFL